MCSDDDQILDVGLFEFSSTDSIERAVFTSPFEGGILGVRLAYVSGGVRCKPGNFTHWGCHTLGGPRLVVAITVVDRSTTVDNETLLYPNADADPRGVTFIGSYLYEIAHGPHTTVDSGVLELLGDADVIVGQEFRLTYLETRSPVSTDDNDGSVNATVLFILGTFDPQTYVLINVSRLSANINHHF